MAHTKSGARASTQPVASKVSGRAGGGPTSGVASKAMTKRSGMALTGVNSNEIQQAVPGRLLTTRVVRRAGHESSSLTPSKLVNHSKGFGSP